MNNFKQAISLLVFILVFILTGNTFGQQNPNILWLVTEDMSPYLRSYGNTLIHTPNLDSLAANGIRFTQAHSNGTQCSPSRSTLISGMYAVSLGTDIHREKRPVPDQFYFPKYLRDAGYYTTNNSKQDYNNIKTPADVWNESSGKASYLNRPDKSKPFFAVYNCGITHMTRVATRTVEGRSPRIVSKNAVSVPKYIPDLPEVRDDIAWNMDAVMLMDKWIGEKLKELRESGEAENTIVFFYSDHGGTVPRGKAYVYESGTHVPFITYFPKKWQHLAGTSLPAISDRLVSFVDFAPSIFSLTGNKTPGFMIGKPFFGTDSKKPENQRKYIFTFRSNQGPAYAPSRAITDGHYKLIWNFQSAYPNGTRQDYQWQMPAQQAWDVANIQNKLSPLEKKFWMPVEPLELYDLQKDSLETVNLAGNKSYSKIFEELKAALHNELIANQDLGFTPREYRLTIQQDGPMYNVVRKSKTNIDKQIIAAEAASYRKLSNLKTLTAYLSDPDPVVQYWGASGICGLAKVGSLKKIPAEATAYFKKDDALPETKCMIAEAMVYISDDSAALNYLLSEVQKGLGAAAAGMQNLGIKAKPVSKQLLTLLNEKRGKMKFLVRSALINTRDLPYSELYAPDEKVGD